MNTIGSSAPAKHLLTDEVRRYFSAMNTGWRVMSKDKRQLLARVSAKARWKLRRQRYGASGQRERSYHQWRVDHNMPPIGEDGRPVSEKLTKPTG